MRQNLVLRTAIAQLLPTLCSPIDDHTLTCARASSRTAATIATQDALIDWVRQPLRAFIPHQSTVLGFGRIHFDGYAVDRVLCVDIPPSFTADLKTPMGEMQCNALDRWIQTRQPQIIETCDANDLTDQKWRQSLNRHSIKNGIVDGIVDFQTSRMVFAFLLNLADVTEHAKDLAHGACTHYLHDAWQRISESEMLARASRAQHPLSPAEHQVLTLLRLGKTNWEIGHILGKSELTVKTQLRRLYVKTGTSNRTQLSLLIP